MARTRRAAASRFLKKFEQDRETYKLATKQAGALLREMLVNTPALIHLITARCKEPPSLWLKLCEKSYGQPARQVTDLIATRVITYYKDDVPIIVDALSQMLEINGQRSVDKRKELAAVEFGYTSVHLIARTKGSWSTSPRYHALRNRWFEVQVRSILDHAWAEIEHEVVYKSGIQFPELVKRRFARMKGAIEILEDEFVALRDQKEQLIEHYKSLYQDGQDGAAEIDSVRLIALLESERPDSLGWRAAARRGKPFPPHIDDRCVKALKRTGIVTGRALITVLRSKELKTAEAKLAREHRLAAPVSHLNTARLAILLKSSSILSDYFPEFAKDPVVMKLYKKGRVTDRDRKRGD